MPTIYFTLADGSRQAAEASVGSTLLQAAERAGVDAFLAECGGCCTCGTCHCVIDPLQWELLPAPLDAENDMLDFVAAGRCPTSRLACQLTITPGLHGLRVSLPGTQTP
jgi:ferredoxin, 2Fe-2S